MQSSLLVQSHNLKSVRKYIQTYILSDTISILSKFVASFYHGWNISSFPGEIFWIYSESKMELFGFLSNIKFYLYWMEFRIFPYFFLDITGQNQVYPALIGKTLHQKQNGWNSIYIHFLFRIDLKQHPGAQGFFLQCSYVATSRSVTLKVGFGYGITKKR